MPKLGPGRQGDRMGRGDRHPICMSYPEDDWRWITEKQMVSATMRRRHLFYCGHKLSAAT